MNKLHQLEEVKDQEVTIEDDGMKGYSWGTPAKPKKKKKKAKKSSK